MISWIRATITLKRYDSVVASMNKVTAAGLPYGHSKSSSVNNCL